MTLKTRLLSAALSVFVTVTTFVATSAIAN